MITLVEAYGLIAKMFSSFLWKPSAVGLDYLKRYYDFLKNLSSWLLLGAVVPLVILIPCSLLKLPVNWVWSFYFIFLGIEAVILMVLAFPIIVAAQFISAKFPGILKSVRLIAAVAFWALMLAVYFYVFPVWENPKMVPLVLMAAAALALGVYTGWVNLPRSLVKTITTVFLVGIFVSATFAFSFPNRTRQFVGLLHNIDEADSKPKQVKVESPDQIQFVNAITGEPQIWYYRSPTGEYELYDRDGFHSSGQKLIPAKTMEERNEIITWFREQSQHTQEEMRKAEERQKQIAQEQEQRTKEETKKAEELAQQQAQEQANQKRETFKNTYLRDRSFLNRSETKEAAIVMVEDKMINQPLGESVAAIFDTNGLRTTTTLFTNKFVTDGLFEKFFDEGGSSEIVALELASNADILILGKRTVSFTTNSGLQNIITAKVTLEAKTISVKSTQTVDTFSVSETGVGFSNDAAVAAAMEKILKQLNYSINSKEKSL